MGTPSTTTDQNGTYRLPPLQPGDYNVRFEQTGFTTLTQQAIHLTLGFTATVNVEMKPGAVTENVTVTGEAPVIDVQANAVSTALDAGKLAELPGSRDFWSIVAQVPAVAVTKMDVGGSNALTQQPYVAYGLTSGNRGEVEGVMVNEGTGGGGSDFYYLDYASMAEVNVSAVGNTAQMPMPGILTQFIAKSGGNQYHGDVYFDYENDAMEGTNIDNSQIAAGLVGSNVLNVHDLNRLSLVRDFNADVGGYIIKDKLWWYGAYSYTVANQRYPTLIDDIQHTWAPVYTGKGTYNINDKQKIIAYFNHEDKSQPDYLGAILISGGRSSPALMGKNTVWNSVYPLYVWKVEYDWVISPSLLFEIRAGQYHSDWMRTGKSTDPRVEDLGSDYVSGGVYATTNLRSRPQTSGSLSYTKSGWWGTHSFKFGGEYMRDTLNQPFGGFPNSCNCISVLNNGAPLDVYLYQGANTAIDALATTAFYANDTWQLSKRFTLNVGIRFDRNRSYLPAQTGPTGQQFAANSNLVTFNNWGPRLGIAYDLTGKGKTVIKASFGQFFNYPAADYAGNANPNASGWYTEYKWSAPGCTGDGNCIFVPGQQGSVVAVSGGSASTTIDPHLKNTYTLQSTAYLEHQLAPSFAVRTGFVWDGRRQVSGNINLNRPFWAYNVPVTVTDPGPDGKLGTADDGKSYTVYNLSPAYSSLSPVNETTNIAGTNSTYYTWEITAVKRDAGGKWSLQASYAKTWNDQTNLSTGSSFTPNQLINTQNGLNVFTNWQAKLNSTVKLKWGILLTPVLRVQSGIPFGRTFVASTNYGSATVLAEPFGAERTGNIPIFDLRSEKQFHIRDRFTLTGFFDLYNIFNNNTDQAVTTSSGSAFLRPSSVTPPRIARVGVKFQF